MGGGYEVIATLLYNQMLGGIPDFNRGAVIAMIMLIPSIGSICILQLLERFNIRYNRISDADLRKNTLRDVGWGLSGTAISVAILSIFAVIFVVPLVEEWPYQTGFSLEHFQTVFSDSSLLAAYGHSLLMALLTAALGTLVAYGAALITARSTLGRGYKRTIESIALVTNAIPGMVLGVAYLFLFSGTSLQNTLLLMVLCNIVHYFSTPYLMMKNALSKMNAGWETTAMLMGDSWLKTILRVVTPNALSSLIEVFSYYFINSMVTISALIFIAGARTMVLTTMIIVDAMSSFGGVDIPVADWGIDFLVSSANKCIQGVPGFSFILCRRDKLLASEGKARSLSLNLLDQWKGMEKDGKWRFTSPTHVVLAFSKALDELAQEGGIPARSRRYTENNRLLIEKMRAMGFATYIDGSHQGPIITTFFYPAGVSFRFEEFYRYIKERGYAIYPGKLTEMDTFRIGNIGEIYPEDIDKLTGIIAAFLKERKEQIA